MEKAKEQSIFRVFQCVTEYHEQKTTEAEPQNRTPYTPISPRRLQEICEEAGATDKEVSQIVGFCVSIIGGLLSSADFASELKAANMGEVIVQVENLKAARRV